MPVAMLVFLIVRSPLGTGFRLLKVSLKLEASVVELQMHFEETVQGRVNYLS